MVYGETVILLAHSSHVHSVHSLDGEAEPHLTETLSHFDKLGHLFMMCLIDPVIIWFRIQFQAYFLESHLTSPNDWQSVNDVTQVQLKAYFSLSHSSSLWQRLLINYFPASPVFTLDRKLWSLQHTWELRTPSYSLCLANFQCSSRSSKHMRTQKGDLKSTFISWLSWRGTGELISILLLLFHRWEKKSCLQRVGIKVDTNSLYIVARFWQKSFS